MNNEWVYNHPDIMQSHVLWARDLGADHNKLLLDLVKDRTVWLLEADARNPQLVPYADAQNLPTGLNEQIPGRSPTTADSDEQTSW